MNRSPRGNIQKKWKKGVAAPLETNRQDINKAVNVQFRQITGEETGQRIDNFLFRIFKGVPKSHVYRIIRSGEVRVNKGRIDQTYRLKEGDIVRIPPLKVSEKTEKFVPARTFDVLYEDDCLLVINKPAGVAVFVVDKETFDDEDALMEIAMDAGAEDFAAEGTFQLI